MHIFIKVSENVFASLGVLTALAALVDPLLEPAQSLMRLKVLLVLLLACCLISLLIHFKSKKARGIVVFVCLIAGTMLFALLPNKHLRLWGWTPDIEELSTREYQSGQRSLEAYYDGIVHYIRREYDKAIMAFDAASDDQQLLPYALNRKANTLRVQKRYNDAVLAYTLAIRSARSVSLEADRALLLANCFHDKGWCLRKLAEPLKTHSDEWKTMQAEAHDCFLNATYYNPSFAKSWYMAGQVCLDRNELEQAKAMYVKAFSLDTEYYRAAYNLALIFADEGKEDVSFSWLERSLQIDANQAFAAEQDKTLKKLANQSRLNALLTEAINSVRSTDVNRK